MGVKRNRGKYACAIRFPFLRYFKCVCSFVCGRFTAMDRFLSLNLSAPRCKCSEGLLACAWIFGLISGIFFSFSAGDSFFSLMRSAADGRVSICGLLSTILLPLLLSAFAVFISKPRLFIPIAFVKALAFAYCGIGVWLAFGSAGWLFRCFLMFSDICMLPVLWWFWIRNLGTDTRKPFRTFLTVLAAALFIGFLDFNVISPFWASLISQ